MESPERHEVINVRYIGLANVGVMGHSVAAPLPAALMTGVDSQQGDGRVMGQTNSSTREFYNSSLK